MSKTEIDYRELLKMEELVVDTTSTRLTGYFEHVPRIIQFFLLLSTKLPTSNSYQSKTLDNYYYQFCTYGYLHLPYTVRTIFILTNRGYYLEASQLLRTILEVIVKIIYLRNHKDQVEAVWLDKKFGKSRISIKNIFDEIVPGYYGKYYGQLLSGFVHGGASTLLFKVNLGECVGDQAYFKLGTYYSEDFASMVANQLNAYLLPYISQFPKLFPETFKAISIEGKEEFFWAQNICNQTIKDHIKIRPNAVNWYALLKPLM